MYPVDCSTAAVCGAESIAVPAGMCLQQVYEIREREGQLRSDTFASVDGHFYCKPHYEQQYKVAGNYSSGMIEDDLEKRKD